MFKTALFGTIGIILFCLGLYFLLRAASLSGFKKTVGRIEKVSIETERRVFYRRRYRYYRSYYRSYFIPRVEYSYQVSGKEYRGDRISLPDGNEFYYRQEAEKAVAGLREGAPVEVYYDPNDPLYSALKIESGGYLEWGVPLFILGLILGGLTVIFFFIERAKIEKKTLRTAMPYRGT